MSLYKYINGKKELVKYNKIIYEDDKTIIKESEKLSDDTFYRKIIKKYQTAQKDKTTGTIIDETQYKS